MTTILQLFQLQFYVFSLPCALLPHHKIPRPHRTVDICARDTEVFLYKSCNFIENKFHPIVVLLQLDIFHQFQNGCKMSNVILLEVSTFLFTFICFKKAKFRFHFFTPNDYQWKPLYLSSEVQCLKKPITLICVCGFQQPKWRFVNFFTQSSFLWWAISFFITILPFILPRSHGFFEYQQNFGPIFATQ